MQHQYLTGKLKAKQTASLLVNDLLPSHVYSMALQCSKCNCIILPKHDNSFNPDHKQTRTKTSDLNQPCLLIYSESKLRFSFCTGSSHWNGHAHILLSESKEKFNTPSSASRVFMVFFLFFQKSQTHSHLQGQVSVYAGQMLDLFFPSNKGIQVPAKYKTYLAASSNNPHQVCWSLTSGMLR